MTDLVWLQTRGEPVQMEDAMVGWNEARDVFDEQVNLEMKAGT